MQFKRQRVLCGYIADFYCAKARLIVELDGGGHYYPIQKTYDERRTIKLEGEGFLVIRICNLEICENFEGVCAFIDKIVKDRVK